MKLKQLYEQSQRLIVAQQNQQQVQSNLNSCTKQMQYHCLEILQLQYPGLLLSFPYRPSSNALNLTYRHQNSTDESDSIDAVQDNDENNESTSDETRCCECENDKSQDDRVRIQTCHELVEYYNAPLDDFIRGLQVLKCLSTFNQYSS
ncbi:hypothetical protein I4U23_010170 [Adineta vaga]|nr:hypothetical protein I4U23_010170 [Adineta vaga]